MTSCPAGTNGIYIAEVQFRSAISGANLATDAARCRADIGVLNSEAPKAIDGDPATDWYSNTGALPHYWVYTFPTPTTIAEYVIQASATFFTGAPKDFTLQYYDGATWHTVNTRIGQTWTTGQSRTYTAGSRPRSAFGAHKPNRRRIHV